MVYAILVIATAFVTMWLTNVLRVRVRPTGRVSFVLEVHKPPTLGKEPDLDGKLFKFWVERS